MSQSQKEIIFKRVLSSQYLEDRVTLCWLAGEPLSAGLEFYNDVPELLERFKKDTQVINHSFQTNGTLINDDWCKYFKTTNANIGVSVDGPAFIHDRNRVNWKGKGTHAFTMRGIKKLQEHGIRFHTISVLSAFSLDYPDEMFEFFMSNNMTGHVCFNFEEYESNNSTSYYDGDVDLETLLKKYKAFYSRFYDLVIKYGEPFQVREFENLKSNLLTYVYHSERNMSSEEVTACRIITINHKGDVSTFSPELSGGYLEEDFSIGNINDVTCIDDLRNSPKLLSLTSEVNAGIKKCKDSCDYFNFCGGGGASNKFSENGTFDSSETRYCKFHKQGLVDLLSELLQPKKSLMEGVQILNIDYLIKEKEITISSGIEWTKSTPLNSYYLEKSKIPKSDWRELTEKEVNTLRYTKGFDTNFSNSISVISIPDTILPKTLLNEIHHPQNGSTIDTTHISACLKPYKDNLVKYLSSMTIDEKIEPKSLLATYIKGFPTTTFDPERNNNYIGLHIDNWENNQLTDRHKSKPRICINLSLKERYFMYINLSLRQMYTLINGLENEKKKIINAQNEIVHTFMTQNPDYPVVKIKIAPLCAYIAPTENIIHDGYNPHSESLDVTGTFFGQFSDAKVIEKNSVVII
jgi:uncharacterized protein